MSSTSVFFGQCDVGEVGGGEGVTTFLLRCRLGLVACFLRVASLVHSFFRVLLLLFVGRCGRRQLETLFLAPIEVNERLGIGNRLSTVRRDALLHTTCLKRR